MKPTSITFCLLLTTVFYTAKAQTIEEQMTKAHPSCRDVFQNAVDVLPKLYRKNAFDSMHAALQIWSAACGETREIQYTRLLLSIQENNFKLDSTHQHIVELLEIYSRDFAYYKSNSFVYDFPQKAFYTFTSVWAKLLLESKKLDDNELLICGVFKGDIPYPEKQISNHAATYSQLYPLIKQRQLEERKRFRATRAFLVGLWMPKKDLYLLGSHPSIGIAFGGRNSNQELDFTMQFRFGKSANPYTFMRNNTLYESTHYFGGYIGIDYTYYFLTRQHGDLGILTGIGFDGFDVTNSNDNKALSPTSTNSLNANGGLKYNWFISPSFCLGLQGRYNLINYCNTGGTSLRGNAFSIDFIIGGNSRPPSRRFY